VEELRAEIAALRQMFPELGGVSDGRRRRRRRGRRVGSTTAAPANGRRRRRGKLSPAGRAAISAAQKKRWAAIKRQRAKGKAASES